MEYDEGRWEEIERNWVIWSARAQTWIHGYADKLPVHWREDDLPPNSIIWC